MIITMIDIIKDLFFCKKCSCCGDKIRRTFYKNKYLIENNIYCLICARTKFNICDCCDNIFNKLIKLRGNNVCSNCFKNKTFICSLCGKKTLNSESASHKGNIICSDCYYDLHRDFEYINIGEKKVESNKFLNNPNKTYTGVEIECINSSRNKNCFIKKELLKLNFSQGTDASLPENMGVEFRSVPMNGDLLFNSIKNFCKILVEKKYYVNQKCGLHIHLEVDQELEFLKKIYLFYLKFEEMFFNMLPKSRRNIKYCCKFNKYYKDSIDDIINVETLNEFKEMIYETMYYNSEIKKRYNDKRYCWINLHSIFYRGTLEVRNHSGTINFSKIINWIIIHQRVLEFLKNTKIEDIIKMEVSKNSFLSIFSSRTQNYIRKRWRTFIKLVETNEEDLKSIYPIYVYNKLNNKLKY